MLARIEVDPGRYIIIPSTSKPAEEGDLSSKHHMVASITLFSCSYSSDRPNDPLKARYYEIFKDIAGGGKIGALVLRDLMTKTYKTDCMFT